MQGLASASGQHKRWAEGGNRTVTQGAEVERRNRKTRRTVDCGVLERTFPVARRLGTMPVIRHYL